MATSPTVQPLLEAWQQDDKAGAVARFLEVDWNARPLFAPYSALSYTEAQIKALTDAERRAKSDEVMPQLDALRRLAAAVSETGSNALAKADFEKARQCFTSLKQCGRALDRPESLAIIKLLGKAFEKKADEGLSQLPR